MRVPLGREGITAPVWINHTEVRGGEGGPREDSSGNCGEVHIDKLVFAVVCCSGVVILQ